MITPVPVPPPRLHVLLRPGAPRAVVLRRGGSKVFCSIGWDLATDQFTVGQWCKHKIYVFRSDLSADGKWMAYFALNGRWKSETRGSFTVVSQAPYLKARWLWPQGDTWGGGGCFYRDPAEVPGGLAAMYETMFVVDGRTRVALGALATYKARLERDGWQRASGVFTKPIGAGWTVRKTVKAEPKELLALVAGDGTILERPAWDWADVDGPRRRLVWAEAGAIHAASIGREGLGPSRLLFDAVPMSFEPLVAPYEDETVIVR